jgi:hypothetical protein
MKPYFLILENYRTMHPNFIRFENFLKYSNNIEFGFLLHKIADLRSKCFIFSNIFIGFEIFVKINLLPEFDSIKIKTCFLFIKNEFSFVLNGTIERAQNELITPLKTRLKNAMIAFACV